MQPQAMNSLTALSTDLPVNGVSTEVPDHVMPDHQASGEHQERPSQTYSLKAR
jgi:hypothetical protein